MPRATKRPPPSHSTEKPAKRSDVPPRKQKAQNVQGTHPLVEPVSQPDDTEGPALSPEMRKEIGRAVAEQMTQFLNDRSTWSPQTPPAETVLTLHSPSTVQESTHPLINQGGAISFHGTLGIQRSNSCPTTLTTRELGETAVTLVTKSVCTSSWNMYTKILHNFQQFAVSLGIQSQPPFGPEAFVLYAAHLFHLGLASSTITSHISALAFWHKLKGGCNPYSSFLLQWVLTGIKKSKPSCDSRLPITYSVLCQLINSLGLTTSSPLHAILYKSMFLLAFHAFLRVGELTLSNGNYCNILCFSDVELSPDSSSISITFKSFKHSSGKYESVILKKTELSVYCPVMALHQYLQVRGSAAGFLYVHPGTDRPLERSCFVQQLNRCLTFCGLSPTLYKTHSFRIGAATAAAAKGMSDAQIRQLGRWRSNAFLRYIRF